MYVLILQSGALYAATSVVAPHPVSHIHVLVNSVHVPCPLQLLRYRQPSPLILSDSSIMFPCVSNVRKIYIPVASQSGVVIALNVTDNFVVGAIFAPAIVSVSVDPEIVSTVLAGGIPTCPLAAELPPITYPVGKTTWIAPPMGRVACVSKITVTDVLVSGNRKMGRTRANVMGFFTMGTPGIDDVCSYMLLAPSVREILNTSHVVVQ